MKFRLLLIALAICVGIIAACSESNDDTDSIIHDTDDPISGDAYSEIPGGLTAGETPMFVSLGFDDNGLSGLEGSGETGGMTWILDYLRNKTNPDGSPVRVSYYMTTKYIFADIYESTPYVKTAWNQAMVDGHEIGNHTLSHYHGNTISLEDWIYQMEQCNEWLSKPFDPNESPDAPSDETGIGMNAENIWGFRSPYLEYNDETFQAMETTDLVYDCSIEDGFETLFNGTNFRWPYTLENGSPANPDIASHPSIWEMPVHPVIAPPDYRCAEYGLEEGLRARLAERHDNFDQASGKITGLDYNMWHSFDMTKDEFVATLKYNLDTRLRGNRAPFLFGAHTDEYSTEKGDFVGATTRERQEAIEAFIDYALTIPEVRIVPYKAVLDWVQNPIPLSEYTVPNFAPVTDTP